MNGLIYRRTMVLRKKEKGQDIHLVSKASGMIIILAWKQNRPVQVYHTPIVVVVNYYGKLSLRMASNGSRIRRGNIHLRIKSRTPALSILCGSISRTTAKNTNGLAVLTTQRDISFVNYDIPALAGSIHSSLMNGGAPGYSHVDKFDDALLVRSACSLEGLLDSTGFESRYYCFCVNQMVCPTHIWHCKVCHKCRDWKTWHCAGCDCCKDGCTIPCDVCSPDMYRSRMEAG